MPAQNVPHQNWQSLGSGTWGANTAYGAGGTPVARDGLDAARMGSSVGRVPSAEYPDGYLGTINSRRSDRLLDSLKNRENQRSYQRGVHKGERIDPGDYLWPSELQPDRGLRNEMKGVRTAPIGQAVTNTHLVNDGKANTVSDVPVVMNQVRGSQLRNLLPTWR